MNIEKASNLMEKVEENSQALQRAKKLKRQLELDFKSEDEISESEAAQRRAEIEGMELIALAGIDNLRIKMAEVEKEVKKLEDKEMYESDEYYKTTARFSGYQKAEEYYKKNYLTKEGQVREQFPDIEDLRKNVEDLKKMIDREDIDGNTEETYNLRKEVLEKWQAEELKSE